jgi:serine/threonine-protein kinase
MDDPLQLEGALLDGKYAVIEAVAEGGFGVVYRGRHESLHCPVAVKVLKRHEGETREFSAQFIEAFAREARTLARLQHPAIVRAMDFGVSTLPSGDRSPWMVLEWLDGETLADRLDARRGRGGVPPAEALALLRPALEAVAHAHDAAVAHRDLKPSNLMCVPGPVPLRVLDFGIARSMEPDAPAPPSGETRSRSPRQFSPPYAAPEQLGGTRTGPWTDVHALGLILTEVLTDEAPYRCGADDTGLALPLAVLADQRPTPAARGVDVGAWEPVLARAVALRPGDRYTTAGALLAALDAALPDAWHRPSGLAAPPSPVVTPAVFAATRPDDTRPTDRRPARWRLSAGLALAALAALAAAAAVLRAPTPSPVAAPVRATVLRSAAPAAAPAAWSPAAPPPAAAPTIEPAPTAAAPVAALRRPMAPARRPAVAPAPPVAATPAAAPLPSPSAEVPLAPAE